MPGPSPAPEVVAAVDLGSNNFHMKVARVERTAARLRQQVAEPLDIQKEKYEHLLRWGARLHEVGLAIAHAQYHKHGAYLLEHADLPGFSRHEQSLLAALVRSHRRRLSPPIFAALPGNSGKRTFHSALLLRLAIVLHRSRSESELPAMALQVAGAELQVRFPPGWLADHPLTVADLRQEAAYLKSAGITLRVTEGAGEVPDPSPAPLRDAAVPSS
jgi:exopolyphosphatase/guanosine-5'-triphosphate,3'-diphosphate pyrophosphatase